MRPYLPLFALIALACGGGKVSPTAGNGLPPGPGTFTTSPLDPAAITNLEPLGAMNPSGHTIPTDHVYFYYIPVNPSPANTDGLSGPWPVLPVYAPGSGKLTWITTVQGPKPT